jgi:hypothetical protein
MRGSVLVGADRAGDGAPQQHAAIGDAARVVLARVADDYRKLEPTHYRASIAGVNSPGILEIRALVGLTLPVTTPEPR